MAGVNGFGAERVGKGGLPLQHFISPSKLFARSMLITITLRGTNGLLKAGNAGTKCGCMTLALNSTSLFVLLCSLV